MKGRKPRPTHLKLLEGNPGKRTINKGEPRPEGDLFEPPSDLPPGAVPFWNQAIADAPRGLLKRLDLRILFIWANAAWLHSDAATKISRSSVMVQSARTGEVYQHPMLSVMNRQATLMLKAAEQMGFSPSSRGRINLPTPRGENNPFDEFK